MHIHHSCIHILLQIHNTHTHIFKAVLLVGGSSSWFINQKVVRWHLFSILCYLDISLIHRATMYVVLLCLILSSVKLTETQRDSFSFGVGLCGTPKGPSINSLWDMKNTGWSSRRVVCHIWFIENFWEMYLWGSPPLSLSCENAVFG